MYIKQTSKNTIIATIKFTKNNTTLFSKADYNQAYHKALLLAKKNLHFYTYDSKLLIAIIKDTKNQLIFSISKISNCTQNQLQNYEFSAIPSSSKYTFYKFETEQHFITFAALKNTAFDLYYIYNTYFAVPKTNQPNQVTNLTQILEFATRLTDIYGYSNIIKYAKKV